ncbi:GNAT family N-acetyltransferase [Mycolicibacterium sphagni]|uniref:GNAT family N-acetyltransferase n=1 Tax=Mycolicibacterium sphagni TaxID=1786 RepID=UPI0021F3B6B4|nr:GNAT family N-acetyltransferase [Mycolicibacterium sphagni]MCV7178926.1 GNAT family N-acetyltransferase [Mycolicibacterium sphagni]
MNVSLTAATHADVTDYLVDARESYCANLVAAGVPSSVATRTADETFSQSFPGDQPAAGHQVFRVEHGGEKAGVLWIGPQPTEPQRWWVFDIVISSALRGQGLGRRAMLLAENEARAQGAVELGLNVFGHNTVAVALYQSLGYEMTSMRMRKPLS